MPLASGAGIFAEGASLQGNQAMSSRAEDEIKTIVTLMKRPAFYLRRPATTEEAQDWSDRILEAERRAVALLESSPADRLALVMALLDTDVVGHLLAPKLVPFVDENDLPTLVERALNVRASVARAVSFLDRIKGRMGLRGSTKFEDVDSVLDEVACQQPELVPREYIEGHWLQTQMRKEDELAALPAFHLVFEDGPPLDHLREIDRRHPTWHLPAEGPSYRLGGPGQGWCPSCEQPLIHLMTLDSSLKEFIGSLPKLVLETCPHLFTKAWYQHDDEGHPTRIAPTEAEEDRYDHIPIQEQKVRLARTPKRWLHQWTYGNLFRLGGPPSWIQAPDIPKAPGTDRDMRLLLQIDSYLPDVKGGSVQLGDSGLLYVFWDAQTRTSCHFIQCT
jgi:hypothetical protein